MSSLEVGSFLKTSFLQKSQDQYFTCLLSSALGRGLDVPTNSAIEENGGVAVIIGQLP